MFSHSVQPPPRRVASLRPVRAGCRRQSAPAEVRQRFCKQIGAWVPALGVRRVFRKPQDGTSADTSRRKHAKSKSHDGGCCALFRVPLPLLLPHSPPALRIDPRNCCTAWGCQPGDCSLRQFTPEGNHDCYCRAASALLALLPHKSRPHTWSPTTARKSTQAGGRWL
jgi:hypothetical protein